MKKLNKVLSVGLSLAMCVSMVAPAFAASFGNLQAAIDAGATRNHKETGYLIDEATGRYGYGDALNEDNTQFEIEAWNDGDTRRVELNADVELDKDGDDADRTNGGIWVWRSDKEVSIELNGHDIDMNPDAVLDVKEGKFYQVDENGEKTDVEATDLYEGTVIRVTGGANLTITDSSAETYVDEEGETHYVAGTGTGKITGGNASGVDYWNKETNAVKSYENGTGAVYVDNGGSFTMEGGSISGNRSEGPVVCVESNSGNPINADLALNLDGVTVENNYATNGGVIYAQAQAGTVDVTIDGCTITGNKVEGDAIDLGLHNKGTSLTASITNTTIKDNRLDKDDGRPNDHGGVALWQTSNKVGDITFDVTFEGCTIQNNGGGCAGIYYQYEGDNGLKVVGRENTICGNAVEGVAPGVSVMYNDGTTLDAMHTKDYLESLGGTVVEATCMAEGSITYTCPYCNHPHTVATEKNLDNHSMGEWYRSKEPGPGVAGEMRSDCQRGCGHYETRPLDPLPVPDDSTVEIEDVEVPLADIFTRADAIGYLWEKSGKPEAELSTFADVPEDHYWAVAIGWAQDMGIAVADEDGNFRPDDLVLRSTEDIEGEFQEFLNRYAVYAGIKLDEGELFIELAGAADDVIMGEEAQAIFNDFFAKLAAALAQAA